MVAIIDGLEETGTETDEVDIVEEVSDEAVGREDEVLEEVRMETVSILAISGTAGLGLTLNRQGRGSQRIRLASLYT